MQKELWIRADGDDDWEGRKELVTTALESGAQAVLVNVGEEPLVIELGRIKVVSRDENSDIFLVENIDEIGKGRNSVAFHCEIKNKEDECLIAEAGRLADYVIIRAMDWKVIPLENLIAELQGKCRILAEVGSEGEARLALETLEVGADGVLADCTASEIKKIKKLIDSLSAERLELNAVKVTGVEAVGEAEAISIDTCSILNLGEGLLADKFLVHSDTKKIPWMEPTPFRINLGINPKIKIPNEIKLVKELKSGDEILSANFEGRTRRLIVNEIKTSKKTMLKVSTNTETILPADSGLVGSDGRKISAGELKPGDEVLFLKENLKD